MEVVAQALRSLEETVDGVPTTIRRGRAKLKPSQRKTATLLRISECAFDTDERGLVEPSGPTIQIIRILDRHPELAEELW